MSTNILITLALCVALAAVLAMRRRSAAPGVTGRETNSPGRYKRRSGRRRRTAAHEPRQRRHRPRLAMTVSDVALREDGDVWEDVEAEEAWDEATAEDDASIADVPAPVLSMTPPAPADVPEVPLDIATAAGHISAPGWPEPGELSYQLSVEDFDPEPALDDDAGDLDDDAIRHAAAVALAETDDLTDELAPYDPGAEASDWVDDRPEAFDPATGWTDDEALPSWETPDTVPYEWDDVEPTPAAATYINGRRNTTTPAEATVADDLAGVDPLPTGGGDVPDTPEALWPDHDVADDFPEVDELGGEPVAELDADQHTGIWDDVDPDEDHESPNPSPDGASDDATSDRPDPIFVEIAGVDDRSITLMVEPGGAHAGPNAWLVSGEATVVADGNAVKIAMPSEERQRDGASAQDVDPAHHDELARRLAAVEAELAAMAAAKDRTPAQLATLLSDYAQEEANRQVAQVLGTHGAVSVNRDLDGLVDRLTRISRTPPPGGAPDLPHD